MNLQNGKPTVSEEEIMVIACEECAEVIQCISKILRFGFDSCNPSNLGYTNRQHLTNEVGDLIAMMTLMVENNIVNPKEVLDAASRKLDKLKMFSNINVDKMN